MRQLRALTAAPAPRTPRAAGSSRAVRALAAIALLALAACDGHPDGWPGMRGGFLAFGAGCPDLTGTYRLHPAADGGRPVSQSLVNRVTDNARRSRWHWETMTVAGNARDSLVLTLRRSPEMQLAYRDSMTAWGDVGEYERRKLLDPRVRWRGSFGAMDDSAYAANLRKLALRGEEREVVRHGEHYTCDGGWLVADRLVHDPGPDRNQPRPDTVIGTVALAVDRERHLVFHAEYPEDVTFSLWCGDGCRGIPLGTWTQHEWARLDSTAPPPVLVEETPWADPFRPDTVTVVWAVDPMQGADEIAALLRPAVRGPVTLEHVARVPGHYRARFRSTGGRAAFHPVLDSLRKSQGFGTLTVTGVAPDGDGHLLWLDVYVASRASATEPTAIERTLRRLMPPGTTLGRVRRDGGVFQAAMTFASRQAYGAMLAALRREPSFQQFEVLQAGQVGEQVTVVLQLRERVIP